MIPNLYKHTIALAKRSLASLSVGIYDARYYHPVPNEGVLEIEEDEVDFFQHAQLLKKIFGMHSINTVIDVGGNVGGYGHFLRHHVDFGGWIHSFEPVKESHRKLAQAAARDAHWKTYPTALGRDPGEKTINIAAHDVFSSFREPCHETVDCWQSENRTVRTEKVTVKRLDEIWSSIADSPNTGNVFLKSDTQGFDLEVIEGAREILGKISGLQLELSMQPIYHNTPTYAQVLDRLEELGYLVAGMFAVTTTPNLAVVEFDCILVKK